MTEAEALPSGCRGTPFGIALVVIAAAGFVTALVIPGDPGPRRAANEATAEETLGRIAAGQARFHEQRGRFGTLIELAQADLIERVVAERGVAGYGFTLTEVSATAWTARAEPAVPGKSGERWFERSASGKVRSGPATLEQPGSEGP